MNESLFLRILLRVLQDLAGVAVFVLEFVWFAIRLVIVVGVMTWIVLLLVRLAT